MLVAGQLHLDALISFAPAADADSVGGLLGGSEFGERLERDREVVDPVCRRTTGLDRLHVAEERGDDANTTSRLRPLIGDPDHVLTHSADFDRVFTVGHLEGEGCQPLDLDGVANLIGEAGGGAGGGDDLLRAKRDRHHHHLDLPGLGGRELLEVPKHAVCPLLVVASVVGPDELHARRELCDKFDAEGRRRAGIGHREHAGRGALEVTARRHLHGQFERRSRDGDLDRFADLDLAVRAGGEAEAVDTRAGRGEDEVDRTRFARWERTDVKLQFMARAVGDPLGNDPFENDPGCHAAAGIRDRDRES